MIHRLECVSECGGLEDAETPVLVPLTTALYVHGTVNKVKSVMVDIGTGYYAEKDTAAGSTPTSI
jgi:prefoldin subunit 5